MPKSNRAQYQRRSQRGGPLMELLAPPVNSDRIICNMVSYVIYFITRDPGKYVFSQGEIKNVIGVTHLNFFSEIMIRTKKILKIFKFELIEMEHGSQTFYIITKYLNCFFKGEKHKVSERLLILMGLSFIIMNGGYVAAEQMWKFVSGLKIIEEKSYFDMQNMMTEVLIEEDYVKYTAIPDIFPPKYEFRWGGKAEEEINKQTIHIFIKMVFNPFVTPQDEEIVGKMHLM